MTTDDDVDLSRAQRRLVLVAGPTPQLAPITLGGYIRMLERLRDSTPHGASLRVQKWVAEGRINAQPPTLAYVTTRRGLPQFWQSEDGPDAKGPACIRV